MLDVDVSLRRGDFTLEAALSTGKGVLALVGPSGAGKSSLIRLMAGLSRPDAGHVAVDDERWSDSVTRRFVPVHRRRVGMVFQTPRLLPHLDVAGNIRLGARGGPVDETLIERLGCIPLLGRPAAGLSGGEQQRVMLARALHGSPKLLLLDEPLTSLDGRSREILLDLLAELLPGLAVPVIYVTHSGEEAGRLAAHFALMRDGRIISKGDAPSVLRTGAGPHFEAGVSSVVSGVVRSVADDGLADIALGDQIVEVPGRGLTSGAGVRLRLWARDLVLAHRRPEGISARNALSGKVKELDEIADGQVAVSVEVGADVLTSLVMARTVAEMGLTPGRPITVLFKSASVERVE
jgi:molybdate transport system ATP-binding protein